jgi:SAM-dependent methyltransferase
MTPVVLRCVECGRDGLDASYACAGCGKRYPVHRDGAIPILIGRGSALDAGAIAARAAPAGLDLERGLRHWQTGALQRWLAAAPRGRLLSYGSGSGGDRRWLESQGFEVTALDIYPTPNTDVVADGHALPFAGDSFDVVTAIAVLQELPDPFRAAGEIARVLRPGGALIGSVAFLEPFTGGNHFNMSHLGVRSLLERSGLGRIELQPGWSSFEALSASFWPWSHWRAGRRLGAGWNRAKYRLGMALMDGMYRLRGKPAPDSLAFHFAGSVLFRAVKP